MNVAENKTVVRRAVDESINANRPDLLGRFVTPDVHLHPGTPGTAPGTVGLAELEMASRAFHAAFSDLRVTLDELFGEGDLISARWTATGTHTEEWAGVPASGRPVHWSGIDIYRFVDGKIAEWWRNDDSMWLFDSAPTRGPRQPLSPDMHISAPKLLNPVVPGGSAPQYGADPDQVSRQCPPESGRQQFAMQLPRGAFRVQVRIEAAQQDEVA